MNEGARGDVILGGQYFLSWGQGLRRNGKDCKLTPQLLALLEYFVVADPPRVVLRQELHKAVWQDVYVARDSLDKAISELRAALHDSSRRPRFIQTVSKRGFKFIANVTVLRDPLDLTTDQKQTPVEQKQVTVVEIPANERSYTYEGLIQRRRAVLDERSFVGRLKKGMIFPGLLYREAGTGPVVIATTRAAPGINDMEMGRFLLQLSRLISLAGWPVIERMGTDIEGYGFQASDFDSDDLFGLTLRYFATQSKDVPLHLRALRYALGKDGLQTRVEFIRTRKTRREILLIVGANPRFS